MKKKITAGMLIATLLLSLNGCGSTDTEEIAVADNQRLAYGMISTIVGNEMTYYEIEESQYESLTGTADSESDTKNDNAGSSDTESAGGAAESAGVQSTESMEQGGPGGGGTPPDMGSGEMPDMGSGSAPEMSSDGAPSMEKTQDASADDSTDTGSMQMPEMDSTEMPSDAGNAGSEPGGGKMNFSMGDSIDVTIPVGIKVHTSSDNVTTFSRLQSGDLIKILYETDADGNEVIVEIWMS